MSTGTRSEALEWKPSQFALQMDRWGDPGGTHPVTVLLRHPTAPFEGQLDAGDELALQAFAHSYLVRANDLAKLGLPDLWLAALDPRKSSHRGFGWLAIDNPSPEQKRDPNPLASFWFERERTAGGTFDRTLILLGTELNEGSPRCSEFGIRVVAHARSDRAAGDEVRITGMSASMPFGRWTSDGASSDFQPRIVRRKGFAALPNMIRPTSAPNLGLRTEASQTPLAANAVPGYGPRQARVFPHNPTLRGDPRTIRKRRPSRPDEMFDKDHAIKSIVDVQNGDLELNGLLQILKSPYVREDLSPDNLPVTGLRNLVLQGDGPPLRSNDFAAVSAYWNLRQWFDRFTRYGISPARYFRGAKLPVRAVYRSGIRPGHGKDGQTINACVQPEDWELDQVAPAPGDPADRPILRMHLALANLSRRERKKWDGQNRSPAIPLGISSDENWIAHEWGHVILMASLGELELRFAHSPGDALAAIIADPFSQLEESYPVVEGEHPKKENGWRGETFTFVSTHRRHDRCVLHGWSWSGSMNRRALTPVPDADTLHRKGYWAEQILSSSLFRLYRCLGGDTKDAKTGTPDQDARNAASHYTIYLILKGLALLADARLAPANHAEQLMAALIEADIGTGIFSVPNDDFGKGFTRIGGCAHKVIDWAFRAQGMYPAVAGEISNAPGVPKDVDIYIEDRRPTAEKTRISFVEHGPGTYVPVSHDWGIYTNAEEPAEGADTPEWFATDEAVKLLDGQIFVTVGNRGGKPARNVSVKVWWLKWDNDRPPPVWNRKEWNECCKQPAQDIPPGETKQEFGPFALKPNADQKRDRGLYLVLAEAGCGDDLPNTDPATRLPCSLNQTPLPELVVNDNNLGLAVIKL